MLIGRPFGSAEGKPFGFAQGKKIRSLSGAEAPDFREERNIFLRPFDFAQGNTFDFAQGNTFDFA